MSATKVAEQESESLEGTPPPRHDQHLEGQRWGLADALTPMTVS